MTVGEALPVPIGDRGGYARRPGPAGGVDPVAGPGAPAPAPRRPRWRDVLLVVALVLIPALGAFVVASLGAERYGARVELLYDTSRNDSEQQADMALSTQVALVESREVLSQAAADVDMAVPDVERSVRATVVTGSEVLHITASAPSKAEARALAAAVAARYLDAANAAQPSSAAALQLLQRQIDELATTRQAQQDDLARLEAARLVSVAGGAATAEERALEESIGVLADRIDQLESRATEIELQDASRDRAAVVSPAYVLPARVSPQPARAAAMGAVAGLALAALAVYAQSSRRRREVSGVAAPQ